MGSPDVAGPEPPTGTELVVVDAPPGGVEVCALDAWDLRTWF